MKNIIQKCLQETVQKYPKTSFMIVLKLYWIVGFFFTIYIIQNEIPSTRQFILGSIYTIVTLPLNYWLTYNFGGNTDSNR